MTSRASRIRAAAADMGLAAQAGVPIASKCRQRFKRMKTS